MIRNVMRRLDAIEAKKAPRQLWYGVPELLPAVLARTGRSAELGMWLTLIDSHYDPMKPIEERDPALAQALVAEASRRTGFHFHVADWGL